MMFLGAGFEDRFLTRHEVSEMVGKAFEEVGVAGKRILVLIPDRTRTAPIPLFFKLFHELIGSRVKTLDYLIALGTHQPLTETEQNDLVGITSEQRSDQYRNVRIFNHDWSDRRNFFTAGKIARGEIEEIVGARLEGLSHDAGLLREVPVSLNRMVLDYDLLVICGPTFPHEVVGFSGGNKYLFPGISGSEVIDYTHWLGAVITNYKIIGTKDTPVRKVIDRAAGFVDRPKLCFSLVVRGEELAGLYIGSPEAAFDAASELSARIHIEWLDKPVERVLSVMPRMYDDIWTAGKGMYKMEPVVADGGEVVIYAPHIDEVSYTHGAVIDEVGYHVSDYFLKQWDRFHHYPGGVLAHSTHVKGRGEFDLEAGVERPRIQVTLATQIPEEHCRRLSLGYLDPRRIDPEQWPNQGQGNLLVPKAGETLYRLSRK